MLVWTTLPYVALAALYLVHKFLLLLLVLVGGARSSTPEKEVLDEDVYEQEYIDTDDEDDVYL